ncbi:uncharacterized protein DFL_000724 [Arthrobotrys flagrans]|uniref:Uncharacterized protein n=1 Tax=Arthrobotrys flagrans TaxID=97331 RepID=A0A437AFJ6_ARTFL|nr:hypothetical protein DFL_000724 [Arthrobotrys flagrans]
MPISNIGNPTSIAAWPLGTRLEGPPNVPKPLLQGDSTATRLGDTQFDKETIRQQFENDYFVTKMKGWKEIEIEAALGNTLRYFAGIASESTLLPIPTAHEGFSLDPSAFQVQTAVQPMLYVNLELTHPEILIQQICCTLALKEYKSDLIPGLPIELQHEPVINDIYDEFC